MSSLRPSDYDSKKCAGRLAPDIHFLASYRRSQTHRRMGYATAFLQDPFRGQASRQEHHWQAGTRVRAAANKVEVAVTVVSVLWPQVSHLHEVVAESECRPFRQVVDAEPVARRVTDLKLHVLFQVGDAYTCCQATDHGCTGTRLQGIPVLSDAGVQVPGGNQHHQRVFAGRSGCWIGACWRMQV